MRVSLWLDICHPECDLTEEVKVTINYTYTPGHEATFDYPFYVEYDFDYEIVHFEGPNWVTHSLIDDAICKLTIHEILNQ